MHIKISIICKVHGEFWQYPNDHLKGRGCSGCNGGFKKTREQFIHDAKQVHGG